MQSACAVLYCHLWPCLAVPYFSTLSHKRHDFRGKVTEHKMCVLIFSTTFVWNFSYSKHNSAIYYHKRRIGLHVKYPLFLSDFNRTSILYTDFRNILNIIFHENPASGSRVVPCGRTDMTRLIVPFHFMRTRPRKRNGNNMQFTLNFLIMWLIFCLTRYVATIKIKDKVTLM